jgi:hypothetical protein
MSSNELLAENHPASQQVLRDLVTISQAKTAAIKNDDIAYLRLPNTTILIHDSYKPERPRNNDVIGDYEIWVLSWLDKEHPGYGPHTFTTYKLFLETDGVRAKRIFELNKTNYDRREEGLDQIEPSLPAYLTDDNPELALVKQALEGYPTAKELVGSYEQQKETINRFFGGDPEEAALGLNDLSQVQAEDLRKLLLTAEPTRDPYFEQ